MQCDSTSRALLMSANTLFPDEFNSEGSGAGEFGVGDTSTHCTMKRESLQEGT